MIEFEISTESLEALDVDLLVVGQYEEEKRGMLAELDRLIGGGLRELAQAEEFSGKSGQSFTSPTLGTIAARRVLVLGLGEKKKETSALDWIQLGATSLRSANQHKAQTMALRLPGPVSDLLSQASQLVLGAALANYRFDHYKSDATPPTMETVYLLLPGRPSAKFKKDLPEAISQSTILAEGIYAARDLVNEPPRTLTPAEMAHRARDMARDVGLDCEILITSKMKELGMNLFLAVAEGSSREPRLIHLTYKPSKKRKRKDRPVLALVGKGITFDSGGLCLKPPSSMINMHGDMAGAAAVFGAMKVIAQLKPDLEVHGYLAASENMTGGGAYKTNDVLTALNGKTVEILNTDAEGRLVLGDTLVYAAQQGATEMIDLATLTGACMVALGKNTAGLMGNDEDMLQKLKEAGLNAGESLWPLPLLSDVRESMKSNVADFTNLGDRFGGAIAAGLFLKEFVEDGIDWAHLDIAGPAFSDKEKHHLFKGGTGFGVATLVQYVLHKG